MLRERPYPPLLWLAVGLAFWLIRGRQVMIGSQINMFAVQLADACVTGTGMRRLESKLISQAIPGQRRAWFAVGLARRQDDAAQERAAWGQVLAHSDEQLAVARAALPSDVELAGEAARRYPERVEAFIWLGDGLVKSGEGEAAIAAYERGLALDPRYAVTWVALGKLYEARGDWRTALRAYDEGCFRHDRGGNDCPNAGRLYLAHEMADLAEARYRAAMAQLPGWQPAKRGLVQALLAQGKTAEAIPHLRLLAQQGDSAAAELLEELLGE